MRSLNTSLNCQLIFCFSSSWKFKYDGRIWSIRRSFETRIEDTHIYKHWANRKRYVYCLKGISMFRVELLKLKPYRCSRSSRFASCKRIRWYWYVGTHGYDIYRDYGDASASTMSDRSWIYWSILPRWRKIQICRF
jgi:hypothetical protein